MTNLSESLKSNKYLPDYKEVTQENVKCVLLRAYGSVSKEIPSNTENIQLAFDNKMNITLTPTQMEARGNNKYFYIPYDEIDTCESIKLYFKQMYLNIIRNSDYSSNADGKIELVIMKLGK